MNRWLWTMLAMAGTTAAAQPAPEPGDGDLRSEQTSGAAPRETTQPPDEATAAEAPADEATAAEAPADEARDREARTRFELGSQLYERGEFAEAVVEFERAYELSGRPSLLYNVYVAERDAGHVAAAAAALRRYLAEEEAPENRELLERRLLSLEAQAERERVVSAQGPTTSFSSSSTSSSSSSTSSSPYVGPIVLLAGGAAMLGAAGGLGLANRNLYGDLEDRCYRGLCSPSDQDDLDALRRRDRTADVLLGVGGAVALGGLVWLIVRATRAESEVTAACGVDGCRLRGSF